MPKLDRKAEEMKTKWYTRALEPATIKSFLLHAVLTLNKDVTLGILCKFLIIYYEQNELSYICIEKRTAKGVCDARCLDNTSLKQCRASFAETKQTIHENPE